MRILIIGSFRWEMYAPSFYDAWRELGYEVKKIDYDEYSFRQNNCILSFLNRVQNRYHYGFYMKRYNQDILAMVNLFKPDIVFLYRCYHIYGNTVELISRNTIVFSYNNDDPFSGVPSGRFYRHYFEDAHHCHLNYVYREKNIIDFRKINIVSTNVLLPYYLKKKNYPLKCTKNIPIAFMGHYENDGRDKYISELLKANIPVVVYGDEKWRDAPLYQQIRDVVFPAKRGREYNETINRTRICLVFFSKLNNDTYTRRCFEIPVARSLMLSEYTDEMNELFPENECAVYFRSKDELVSKAAFLLNNTFEIDRISKNAYSRIMQLKGSEYDRCQQIIEDYQRICVNSKR